MGSGQNANCEWSSVRLILRPLIHTSVPNRTLWCHPSASSGVLGSTAGHQRSASHGVLHYVSGQRQEMVSCLHDWTASEGGEALTVEVHCLAGPYGVSLPPPLEMETLANIYTPYSCVPLRNCHDH